MPQEGRIFITGDTHGHNSIGKLSARNWSEGKSLTKKDYIIVSGDFGLIWNKLRSKEEEHWIKWLDDQPFTTLFIDGNHENFDVLDNLPEKELFGGIVGIVSHSVFHLRRGHLYRINAQKILTIGGAHSHDREYRTYGKSMWKREEITDEDIIRAKKALEDVDFSVDHVITHCAPSRYARGAMPMEMVHYWNPDGSENNLDWFLETSGIQFGKWWCGHYHTDFGPIVTGKFECIYNRIHELTIEEI